MEAGGVNRAIARVFNVTVSENYLEIHLFWAGKGTCCVPDQGYYGSLIATVHAASGNNTKYITTITKNTWFGNSFALHAICYSYIVVFHYSDFIPSVSGIPPNSQEDENKTSLIVGITVPVAIVSLILVFAAVFYMRRKKDEDDEEGKKIETLNLIGNQKTDNRERCLIP